jgi:hypothetical protein
MTVGWVLEADIERILAARDDAAKLWIAQPAN